MVILSYINVPQLQIVREIVFFIVDPIILRYLPSNLQWGGGQYDHPSLILSLMKISKKSYIQLYKYLEILILYAIKRIWQ